MLKEGSKDADVNKCKFVLNIDVLFATYMYVGEAVKAVIHNYQPLLLLLEEASANDEPTSMELFFPAQNITFTKNKYIRNGLGAY